METKPVAIFAGMILNDGDNINFAVLHQNHQLETGTAPVSKLLNFLGQGNTNFKDLSDPVGFYCWTEQNSDVVNVCVIDGNGKQYNKEFEIGKLYHWIGEVGQLARYRSAARKTA